MILSQVIVKAKLLLSLRHRRATRVRRGRQAQADSSACAVFDFLGWSSLSRVEMNGKPPLTSHSRADKNSRYGGAPRTDALFSGALASAGLYFDRRSVCSPLLNTTRSQRLALSAGGFFAKSYRLSPASPP